MQRAQSQAWSSAWRGAEKIRRGFGRTESWNSRVHRQKRKAWNEVDRVAEGWERERGEVQRGKVGDGPDEVDWTEGDLQVGTAQAEDANLKKSVERQRNKTDWTQRKNSTASRTGI